MRIFRTQSQLALLLLAPLVLSALNSCASQPPIGSLTPEIYALCEYESHIATAKLENPLIAQSVLSIEQLLDEEVRIQTSRSHKLSNRKKAVMFTNSLCREYADSPKTLEEKLILIGSLLPTSKPRSQNSLASSFSKLTKNDLEKVSAILKIRNKHYLDALGKSADNSSTYDWTSSFSTKPLNRCEVLFSLDRDTLRTNISSFDEFSLAYSTFQGGCSELDTRTYVFFRGDSTFGPLFGESSANRIRKNIHTITCNSKDKRASSFCNDYYRQPLQSRKEFSNAISRTFLQTEEQLLAELKDVQSRLVIFSNSLNNNYYQILIPSAHTDNNNIRKAIRLRQSLRRYEKGPAKLRNSKRKELKEVLAEIGKEFGLTASKNLENDSANLHNKEIGNNLSKEQLKLVLDRHIFHEAIDFIDLETNLFFSKFTPFISASSDLSVALSFAKNKDSFDGFLTIFELAKEDIVSLDPNTPKTPFTSNSCVDERSFSSHYLSFFELPCDFYQLINYKKASTLSLQLLSSSSEETSY